MTSFPSSRAAEWFDDVLRVTAVTLLWLAVVLATALLCRPWPGTEVLLHVARHDRVG